MPLEPHIDTWNGHERTDDPWWNESAWFGFSVPERRINGWFYFWHRPNMGLTAGGVALWDDRGQHRDDCLYYHWFPFNPLPRDGDMFDFTLSNGMSVELVQPLREYRLRFADDDLQLELDWHGTVEAQVDRLEMATSSDIGAFHYDQLGHVEGQIVLGGERLDVDTHHVRDRSWGVRRPFPRGLRGGLDMGWGDNDTAFCATFLSTEPVADEASTSEPLAYGHFVKDGVVSVATAGRHEVDRAHDGTATAVRVELEDAGGRVVCAAGRPRNCLRYDDLWNVDWMLTEWDDIDGAPGWGEMQDMPARVDMRRRRRRALEPGSG